MTTTRFNRRNRLSATHPARRIARVGKLLDAGLINEWKAAQRVQTIAQAAWEAMDVQPLKRAA